MQVISATNGQDAINLVEATDDLSLVLMDVMMPEMDGYETMRRIRSNPKFRLLPIIALTAKAMKGDREKCLEAGASDYVAKPVNTEQLLSLVQDVAAPLSDADARNRGRACRAHARTRSTSCWSTTSRRGCCRTRRSWASSARTCQRALGRRGAGAPDEGRVRGGAARRQHAGHGRLRDRGDDPRSSALRAHADHLRHRRARHRVRPPQGLQARRGRLRVDPGRAGDPAQQGVGAGRAASASGASCRSSTAASRRRTRSWSRPTRRCRRRRTASSKRSTSTCRSANTELAQANARCRPRSPSARAPRRR